MLFVWIDPELDGPFFWWFAGRTFLSNNCVTACFQVPTIPRGRPPRGWKLDTLAPTSARSGFDNLVGEKHAQQPNKFPTDKCIYLIFLDGTTYTTSTPQETNRHHTPFPCVKD
jgi:hypothetical protein